MSSIEDEEIMKNYKKIPCFHLKTELEDNYLYLIKIQYVTFSIHLFIQQILTGPGQAPQHKRLTHNGRAPSKLLPSSWVYVWAEWKITGIFDVWTGIPRSHGIELGTELVFSISQDKE